MPENTEPIYGLQSGKSIEVEQLPNGLRDDYGGGVVVRCRNELTERDVTVDLDLGGATQLLARIVEAMTRSAAAYAAALAEADSRR